ncbi:hypothetical protein BATDEDRAFT_35280 [Batrachochytrium dendrobatidis JAM81]|uniref:Uncharacterized protein n=2 Tax=Batrachochytrium dendrobatidis TaxID=109871 RepID=F4P427_BATDJ|nr:uncharacterized protein BATDEDRAFT_35280 [Batrachochytrium dendrobatidis JAM81]EGF79964.1 hypothetical protein BATDEDRAFT_35280 [Batrachochytrium dendrobatidis JAM81]KAJ8323216.1 hypothetical protein O5D80_007986 [Batrachochytrium dendrobatidis]KAK5672927.1 hypothetical protein QVD99_000410 [Batrachochytrium dendrobatidis]OAJ38936.1 hypothetical protein BDEG_22826 [Batrachochytrium dendrobatidis JEL423]|eukprot:XP_006679563.1 hypothetical protein BATDEDRAFT_35280 [Batrachochytrium dendrobatidis JAM81]
MNDSQQINQSQYFEQQQPLDTQSPMLQHTPSFQKTQHFQQPHKSNGQRPDVAMSRQSSMNGGRKGSSTNSGYPVDSSMPHLKRPRIEDTPHPYQPQLTPMMAKAASMRGILLSGYEVVNGPFSDSKLQRRPPRQVPVANEFQANMLLQREDREREAEAEKIASEAGITTLGTWESAPDSKFNNMIIPILPRPVSIPLSGSTNTLAPPGGAGSEAIGASQIPMQDLHGASSGGTPSLHDLIMSRNI